MASTASSGSVAVSRAMTTTPASRAFLIESSTPVEEFGVIRMPFTPWPTMFSMAATWPSLSPSNAPASAISLAPSLSACAWAASRNFTKYGFESVLVISPTLTLSEPDPPQAVSPGTNEPATEPPRPRACFCCAFRTCGLPCPRCDADRAA